MKGIRNHEQEDMESLNIIHPFLVRKMNLYRDDGTDPDTLMLIGGIDLTEEIMLSAKSLPDKVGLDIGISYYEYWATGEIAVLLFTLYIPSLDSPEDYTILRLFTPIEGGLIGIANVLLESQYVAFGPEIEDDEFENRPVSDITDNYIVISISSDVRRQLAEVLLQL